MSQPSPDRQFSEARRAAGGRRHFLALDSLRGICACFVALSHFHSDGWIAHLPLVVRAAFFVDFFFVLSGFVIMASYGDRLRQGFSTARFMALRLGRIYPLHVVVLLAMLAVQLVSGIIGPLIGLQEIGYHPVGSFVRTLFLVQIFSTQELGDWNLPTWSIAAEMWAYLLFALLLRFSGRFAVPATIAVICIAPAFSPDYLYTIQTGALPRCLYGFGIGVLCLFAWRRMADRLGAMSFGLASALEFASVAAALAAICWMSITQAYFVCPWIFAAVILLLAAQRGAISSALLRKPLLIVGTLSFSIYLVHEFVEARIANVMRILHVRLDAMADRDPTHIFLTRTYPVPLASDLVTIAALLVTIGVAYLTFRLVEEPARDWSRRMLMLRKNRVGDQDTSGIDPDTARALQ